MERREPIPTKEHTTSSLPAEATERRRMDPAIRVPLEREVTIQTTDDAPPKNLPAVDLGPGGVFVCTDDPLPEASRVQLCFDLDGADRVRCAARVVRTVAAGAGHRPHGMALCFEGLPEEPAAALQRFLRRSQFSGPTLVGDLDQALDEALLDQLDPEVDPVCTEEFARFCCEFEKQSYEF